MRASNELVVEVGDLIDATVHIGALTERYTGEVLAVVDDELVSMSHPHSPARGLYVYTEDTHGIVKAAQRREDVQATGETGA